MLAQAVPLSIPINGSVDHATHRTVCKDKGCQLSAHLVNQTLDLSFDPCNDFYHFACGNRTHSKIANNLVEFLKNSVTINKRLHELIDQPSTPDEARPIVIAKTYYKECMNTALIEEQSLEPLKKLISKFGGWPVVEGAKWNQSLNWTELTHSFITSGVRSGFLVDLDVMVNVLHPAKHNRIIRVNLLNNNDEYIFHNFLFLRTLR